MANVVCPECRGEKGGFRVTCGSRGCETSTFDCEFCKGEGQVSAEANGRWQKGRELREARKQQGMTQCEQALILGISPIDLNDVECGRRPLEDVPRARHAKE